MKAGISLRLLREGGSNCKSRYDRGCGRNLWLWGLLVEQKKSKYSN
jgi:hypothetical protein